MPETTRCLLAVDDQRRPDRRRPGGEASSITVLNVAGPRPGIRPVRYPSGRPRGRGIVRAGLAPVHRRAVANAKRLSRTKLK